jgi:histidinol-phosphate phosphatase family protein
MIPPANPSPLTPAVFLDRDGTLMEEVNYCRDPALVSVFPDAAAALAQLRQRGFQIIMVTNQSGIGRGYFTEQEFQTVQAEVLRQLGEGLIDAVYFCPDAPDQATDRRKPGPGMILEAAAEHGIDLARSYLIGDTASDIECARRAGLAGSALVLTGHGRTHEEKCQPDCVASNLAAAADWVLQQDTI